MRFWFGESGMTNPLKNWKRATILDVEAKKNAELIRGVSRRVMNGLDVEI